MIYTTWSRERRVLAEPHTSVRHRAVGHESVNEPTVSCTPGQRKRKTANMNVFALLRAGGTSAVHNEATDKMGKRLHLWDAFGLDVSYLLPAIKGLFLA